MQPTTRAFLSASLAGGLLLAGAGTAGASVARATMTTTKTGKIAVTFTSSSAFTITVSGKNFVVKTNDMTHVTIDSKVSKVSALKKGETVTVKGDIEMETITATSVVELM